MLILFHIGALVLIAVVAWWLSGYDSKLTHANRKQDFTRRGIRCGVTLLLVEILFWLPTAVLVIPVFLAVIWAGCLAELASLGIRRLIDPEDKRAFDPARNLRELDVIASLIRDGKKAEAVQLCQQLKAAGEVDAGALDLALEHLGVPQTGLKKMKPLVEAGWLRSLGKFNEAEAILNSLLAKNPGNVDAAMLLVRLYAQDLQEPDKAEEILGALERQPQVPASDIEAARRSMAEWWLLQQAQETETAPPESVDDLLARKYFGTAIEMLEDQIRAQPQDFALRLKLAEVHAVHCKNFHGVEKIIRQLEMDPGFSPQQIESARVKLREWRGT
jgi:tetratricopeptide (TPR) repeat protein